MTFAVSVAAGAEAAAALEALCRTQVASGEVSLTRHEDLAVAWAADGPWVDCADDGQVLVVLDGRVHNEEFPSAGQAAPLLRRYREGGIQLARDLLGDFVVIVMDRARRTLLVSRDPVGVRPWYQATKGRNHAGASDLATLARLSWVDTEINEQTAIEYLAAVEESRGETLYRGIGTLRPGQTWHGGPSGATTFHHHRWELEPELGISWDEAAERCRALLRDAVRSRLDVTGLAACDLSGGLDSSSVVGTVALLGRNDLLVGRLVFDGPRADERRYSDAVIAHWGLRAVSAPPWMPSEEESRDLTRELRRPPPDANFTMFAGLHSAMLAEGRRDGLTGLGGDDAFVAMGIGPRILSALKLRQRRVVGHVARRVARDPRRAWSELVRPTLGYLAAPWRRKGVPTWVDPAAAAEAALPRLLSRRPERVTGIDAIDERMAAFTSGYNASILETRTLVSDRAGRRESHPFLDPRFVRGTYGLDPWWPTRGGHYRALEVEAFRDRLPPSVADRISKADFSEIFWPQALDDATLDRVRSGPLAQLGWLDADGFDALATHAKKGMANVAIPLFRCVSLDHWMRTQ